MQQLGGLCGCAQRRTGEAHCRDWRSLSSRARRIGWLRRASQSTMRRYTRSWPRRVAGATSKIAKAAVPKQPRILTQRWPAATRQPGTRRTMLSVSTLQWVAYHGTVSALEHSARSRSRPCAAVQVCTFRRSSSRSACCKGECCNVCVVAKIYRPIFFVMFYIIDGCAA